MLRKDRFKEKLSPFLKEKLLYLETTYGDESPEYLGLATQYLYTELEEVVYDNETKRHYEADTELTNIERLYKPHCCVELNFSCTAHCRICLRNSYEKFVLTEEQVKGTVDYLISINAFEVLITGGDPLLSLKRLDQLVEDIVSRCPSIKIIRIATRVFTQDPERINDQVIDLLKKFKSKIRIEVATQIGHPIELTFDEVRLAFKKVIDLGIPVYSQNVFTKVLSNSYTLIELYTSMRSLGIESHYLFHCSPIKGIQHLRSTLRNMFECYEDLVNSGQISGRSKPIMAIMSSIGKITLTPFNVLDYVEGEYIKLRSNYKYSDRILYNPLWKLPESAWVDENDNLCITYLDGVI